MRSRAGFLCALLSALCLVCVSCSQTPDKSPEPIKLFNGQDLVGWDYYLVEPEVKMGDVWSVQDGMMVCKGEPLGYIHTRQDFTSFKLVVEWRWAPGTEPGNNGVLMRINGEPTGVPRCIEMQLKSGNEGDLYGFHGMQINGDPDRIKRVENHELVGDLVGVSRAAGAENKPGEWNMCEIVADGANITVSINGQEVNQATECDVLAGPIALQSEGGEIHFRKVELTPIEPKEE